MATTRYNRRRRHSFGSNLGFGITLFFFTLALIFMVFADIPKKTSTPNEIANIPDQANEIETVSPTENVSLPFELHQIDVGCANAYLIRYDGCNIMIDGGQSFSYKTVSNYLENLGVEYIDTYIVTHWHGDHADNLTQLLEKYAYPGTIIYGTSEETNSNYPIVEGRYKQLKENDTITIKDVVFTCVGPYEVKQDGTSNPDSLNIVIEYNDFKVMITGDYVYDEVLESHADLIANVDVLQMPHHGLDPLCISQTVFKHCNPKLVLVPANSSSPTNKLVRELKMDCQVLNNQSGCIAIVTYGNDYTVYTGVISSDFEY